MQIEVGVSEAKMQLSKLLELVRKGERVIITKYGVPVAELTAPGPRRAAGYSEIFTELKAIRERTKPGAESIKSMIEEKRRR